MDTDASMLDVGSSMVMGEPNNNEIILRDTVMEDTVMKDDTMIQDETLLMNPNEENVLTVQEIATDDENNEIENNEMIDNTAHMENGNLDINLDSTLDNNGINQNESTIMVAVRVRPFNEIENKYLIQNTTTSNIMRNNNANVTNFVDTFENNDTQNIYDYNDIINRFQPEGIYPLVNCIDDKMLVFNDVNTISNYNDPMILQSINSNQLNANTNPNGTFDPNNSINHISQLKPMKRNFKNGNRRNGRRISSRYDSLNGGESSFLGDESKSSRNTQFMFDKLFDMNTTQDTVYNDTCSSILSSVLNGYNGTIFAYGATGCGKTYTINGDIDDPNKMGVLPRIINDLYIGMEKNSSERDCEIYVSFLEIYNEKIRDLLKIDTPSDKLVICEDNNNSKNNNKKFNKPQIRVQKLSEYSPKNLNEMMELINCGNYNRTTSTTEANKNSSRSHSVLQIRLEQIIKTTSTNSNGTEFNTSMQREKLESLLTIIDLAGSERASTTKNRGMRLYEGANINKSLLALGNCINALSGRARNYNRNNISNGNNINSKKKIHVPYRDSKLTRLLKYSLGGNCQTLMIVCIAPSSLHYEETLNTLRYAQRAKEIKTYRYQNRISVEEHIDKYVQIIQDQIKQIDKLKEDKENIRQNYELSIINIQDKITNMVNEFSTLSNQDSNGNLYETLVVAIMLKCYRILKTRILDTVENITIRDYQINDINEILQVLENEEKNIQTKLNDEIEERTNDIITLLQVETNWSDVLFIPRLKQEIELATCKQKIMIEDKSNEVLNKIITSMITSRENIIDMSSLRSSIEMAMTDYKTK